MALSDKQSTSPRVQKSNDSRAPRSNEADASGNATIDLDSDKAKRRWQRYEVEVRVNISLTRAGKPYVHTGVAHDISEGGMRLFSAGELFEGETLTIDFSLPYGRRVLLQGVVRNRVRHDYGVEYLDPSQADRDEIIRNCRALSLLK